MADRSDDPRDNLNAEGLRRDLNALQRSISRDIEDSKKVARSESETARSRDKSAAKDEATARENRKTANENTTRSRYEEQRLQRLRQRAHEARGVDPNLLPVPRETPTSLVSQQTPAQAIESSANKIRTIAKARLQRATFAAVSEGITAGAQQAAANALRRPTGPVPPDALRTAAAALAAGAQGAAATGSGLPAPNLTSLYNRQNQRAPLGRGGISLANIAREDHLNSINPNGANLYRQALQAAEGEQAYARSLQESTRHLQLSSDAYRRHGALTTEFISAAAKGQVTIRELGFQVGATVAKFAGWTLAASLVYGAATAVGQLGSGAIQSLNGVNQLERVVTNLDTQKAQREFRALAKEFNLPIEDVANASYGLAKVFRDQDQIFSATRQALFAMKVGELDTVSATRYLTAIVNGFQKDASALPKIFDEINQAQNRFGGNTGQLIEGVAKAGGAFRAAGGDVEYLISLIQTGVKVTGRTGSEIATAVQRSAEITQRPNRRNDLIALLGIDPRDSSIEDVYRAAFQRARGASAEEVNQIATTIATPQLAARIVPILQNERLFKQVFGEIKNNSEGSAERELNRALRAPSEQIKKLGTNLQRIGSALAESGLLVPIVGLVGGLNAALDTTEKILSLFGLLPDGLTKSLAVATELAAVIALMRRLDVGGQIAVAPGFLTRGARGRGRAEILSGLDSEVGFYRNERRGFAARQAPHNLELARLEGERARLVSLKGVQNVDAELIATQARINTAEAAFEAEKARQLDVIQREQATVQKRRSFARQTSTLGGRRDPDAVARDLGILYRGELDPPVAQSPRAIDEDPARAARQQQYGAAIAAGEGAERADAATVAAADRDVQAKQRIVQSYREMASESGRLTAASTIAGAQVAAGWSASKRALTGLGGAFRDLGQAFGPTALIGAALLGVPAIYEARKRHLADQAKTREKLAATPDGQAARDQLRRLAEDKAQGGNLDETAQALKTLRYLAVFEETRAKQLERGQVVTGYSGPELDKLVAGDVQALRSGQIDHKEFNRLMDQRIQEVTQSTQDAEHQARTRANLRQKKLENAANVDFYGALLGDARTTGRGLDTQELSRLDDTSGGLESLLGVRYSPKAAERLAAQRLVQAARLRNDSSPKGRGDYADAQKSIATIRDAAKTDLDRALLFTRTREGRERAYAQYFDALRSPLRAAANLRSTLEGQRDTIQGEIDAIKPQASLRGRGSSVTANRTLQRLLARRRELNDDIRALGKETASERRRTNEAIRQARIDKFEEDSALQDAETGARQYSYSPGVDRASYLLRRIAQKRDRAIRLFGRDSRQVLDLTASLSAQQEQIASEELSLIDARSGLAEAGSDTEAGAGSARLKGLRQKLAFMRAHPKIYGTADLLGVQADILRTTKDLARQAEQAAQDLIAAQLEFDLSKTEDPVRQARLRLDAAKRAPAGRTTAERLRNRAEINNRRRDYRQSRQQDAYEQIQFDFDLGRIDRETLIARLESLLGNLKGNRELRRQIQRQVAQLKKESESEYELNVGNIKLPSLYEIARATQGKTDFGGGVVNRNVLSFTINGPQDYDELGRVLEEHVAGGGKAVARAAGMR